MKTLLHQVGGGLEEHVGALLADNIHRLPEALPTLDFALLRVDEVNRPPIGSGGSARVFDATYRGTPVALKLLCEFQKETRTIKQTSYKRLCSLNPPLKPSVRHSPAPSRQIAFALLALFILTFFSCFERAGCMELDESTIANFCRECAILASLPAHPNILPPRGLCK